MYLSAKEKEAEQRALLEKQKHLEEILWRRQQMEAQKQSESMSAMELVDDMFGFLPDSVGGQEGQAPVGFEVWKNCFFFQYQDSKRNLEFIKLYLLSDVFAEY